MQSSERCEPTSTSSPLRITRICYSESRRERAASDMVSTGSRSSQESGSVGSGEGLGCSKVMSSEHYASRTTHHALLITHCSNLRLA